ncbi:amino acid/amide ABC transporter membrane protein 1, HAAT family [Thermomonospora echinospora]|uniref:Amino acid/amide ABC transporter membrane protein 1, HAAT family n=1 Tax=Thermomonospora echinospora TaxID=1992 RepID=A0A1H6E780_9ACTN|nr:branched-chain amino acid ABC transporter permease [Thermomonospora echinospora]SEG93517.1 amino acid/amide ABC transporter membrane protein 1, HAAT family [Thermomonospora echinospora]
MALFLQRLIDGIGNGMLYGAVALALVLIYRATGMVNFAQGEMAMFCTFITWKLADHEFGLGLPIVAGIAGGVIFGFLFGAALERVVIRPFESADHLRQMIVTLGLFLAINALAAWIFTADTQRLASPFPSGALRLGGVSVSYHQLGVIAVLLVMALALRELFGRTRLGLAIRGASMNPESSRLLGVDVSRMLMIGWGLSAAIGALAGALVAPAVFVSPGMMQTLLLYGFAAAVLGGFDSAPGALVGGVMVGVVQAMVSGYVPAVGTQLQLATAFALILMVLLVRPQGLFGRVSVERV